MFEQLFRPASTVEVYRTAPLVDSRLRYLTHWLKLGATRTTLRKIACNQALSPARDRRQHGRNTSTRVMMGCVKS